MTCHHISLMTYNICIVPFSNSAACSSAVRKPAISLADSTDLRVLLNIMYLMVETIQQDDPADKPEWKIIRETFRAELGTFHQDSCCGYKLEKKKERKKKKKKCYVNIFHSPFRISSFQQRAHFCHALQYGDQVLQWPSPPFPNEEGLIAVVEEYSGERGGIYTIHNQQPNN